MKEIYIYVCVYITKQSSNLVESVLKTFSKLCSCLCDLGQCCFRELLLFPCHSAIMYTIFFSVVLNVDQQKLACETVDYAALCCWIDF